ncbi:MAG: hypothetical protein HY538_07040 [Deltaproteobacteria bacterium]|nr:hypothetical protein [Deltaproteobacteria bacterium]
MSYQYYDVLISSHSLEGLIAGSMLAKGGARVLVLDHYSPYVERGPYRFDIDPSPFTRLGTNGLFQKILKNLNLSYEEQKRFQLLEPTLQILKPRMRLSIPSQLKDLKKELTRECPENANELLQFRTDLHEWLEQFIFEQPPLPWWKVWLKKSKKEEPIAPLENLKSKEVLAPFLAPMAQSFSSYSVHTLSSAQRLYLALGYLGDAYYYRGGKAALRDLFRRQLKFYGGECLPEAKIEKIHVEHREIRTLELDRNPRAVRCRYVVRIGKGADFFGLCPEGFRLRRWVKRLSQPSAMITHRLYFGLKSEGVPVGLGPRALLISNSNRYLVLTLSPEEESSYAPAGKRILTVEMHELLNPETPTTLTSSKEKEMFTLLKEIFPFLEQHIDLYLPGNAEGLSSPSVLWSPKRTRKIGKTPFRNAYYLGPEGGDGLGFENRIQRIHQVVENLRSNLFHGAK